MPRTVLREAFEALDDPQSEPAVDLGFVLDFLSPSDQPGHLGRFGAYEVIALLGRGGMGVVLKALDPALNRYVAIKVLAPQFATSVTARRRFAREAKAAAAVSHDHVVAIHAVDEANGLPYLVMQYVPGVTLQEQLERSGPLELREVLRIGMQVAAGLAAAHGQGLIHRDVKPANILLENGVQRVKLTDFGLARAVDDASLTQHGVLAGTPEYMAPEQARGGPLDHRADLFSLGSVLYALCTGRPPFRGDSTAVVLKRVEAEAPRPLRDLNPDVPAPLAEVIDTLLAKDPANRFQSAAEVADLLRGYLAHLEQPAAVPMPARLRRTTPSRPASPRRWLLAAGLALALVGGLGITEATGRTEVVRYVATVLRIRTPDGTLVVEVDDPQVKVSIDNDGKEIVVTGAGVQEIRLRPGEHQVRATKDDQLLHSDVVTVERGDKRVLRISREANTRATLPQDGSNTWAIPARPEEEIKTLRAQVERLMLEKELLQLEKQKLLAQTKTALDEMLTQAAEGKGSRAADLLKHRRAYEAALDDLARAVEARPKKGEPGAVFKTKGPVQFVAFSPDGRRLLAGEEGTVQLWDVSTASLLWRSEGHAGTVWAGGFSPDGLRVATAGQDETVRLWDAKTGKELTPLKGHEGQVYAAVFSPDGRHVLSGGEDHTLLVWDVATGRGLRRLRGHTGPVRRVAVAPDGRRVLSSSLDGTLRQWDVATAKLLHRWDDGNGGARSLAYSPDGKLILSDEGARRRGQAWVGEDFALRLYDAASGREVRRLHGHTSKVESVAFAPDGRQIVSGGYDRTVRLWDVATERELRRFEGHSAEVTCVAFAPGGRQIASASRDGTVRHYWLSVEKSAGNAPAPSRTSQRQLRWVLRFDANDGQEYLRRLQALGASVVLVRSNQPHRVLKDLTQRPANWEPLPEWPSDRLCWLDSNPDSASVKGLLKALGLAPERPFDLGVLFPPTLEARLRQKERERFPGSEDAIDRTIFKVVPRGDSYDVEVVEVIGDGRAAGPLRIEVRQAAGKPVILLDGEAVALDQLNGVLRRLDATRRRELVLEADAHVPYETVRQIQQAAKEAGVGELHYQRAVP